MKKETLSLPGYAIMYIAHTQSCTRGHAWEAWERRLNMCVMSNRKFAYDGIQQQQQNKLIRSVQKIQWACHPCTVSSRQFPDDD